MVYKTISEAFWKWIFIFYLTLMNATALLSTDRISISHLCRDDADFILELLNTPGWLEFIGDRNVKTMDEAESYIINGPMENYKQEGLGLNVIRVKESGKRVGICGLLKRDYLDHPDLGFALLPEFEGHGLMYEASKELIKWAANIVDLEIILAITSPANLRSKALLSHLGFGLDGTMYRDNETICLFQKFI